jgi:hypothetical protein
MKKRVAILLARAFPPEAAVVFQEVTGREIGSGTHAEAAFGGCF